MKNYKKNYKEGKAQLPEGNENPEDFVQRAEYYWGMHIDNNSMIGPVVNLNNGYNEQRVGTIMRRTYDECRRVANGTHDVEQFKDLLDRKNRKGRRTLNISWEPLRIGMKYVDMVVDKLVSTGITPVPRLSDMASIRMKKKEEYKMRVLVNPETQRMLAGTGIQPTRPEGMELVSNEDDLNYFLKMLGVTLPKEVEMKDKIDATEKESNKLELDMKCASDKVALNAMAIHRFWDGDTVKEEYWDPMNLICRQSMYDDCRDIDFVGCLKPVNLTELRATGEFTEDELQEISTNAQKYWNRYETDLTGYVGQPMRNCANGLPVFQFYFIDTQPEYYITGVHPEHGNKIFRKVKADAKITGRNSKGLQKEQVVSQYLYRCSWIVGTNKVYSYGQMEVIPRKGDKGKKKVVLPVTLHIGHKLSLIERIIGIDKDIQIDTYNIRKLLTKIPPGPRMIIDKSKIKPTMKIGQDKYTVLDSLKRFYSDGVFVIESNGAFSLPGIEDDPRSDKAIDFVKVNFGEDLGRIHENIMRNITLMKQIFGFNDVTDGTSNDPRMLNGVADNMIQQTSSSLKPTLFDYYHFKERSYDELVHTYQSVEPDNVEFKMDIRVETPEDRMMIKQDLLQFKDALDPDVYYMIQNIIREGDISKAQFLLSIAIRRAKRQAHQQNLEIQKATEQANVASANAKVEGDMKREEHKVNTKRSYEAWYMAEKDKYDKLQFEREKELKLAEKALMIEGNKEVLRENQQ